MKYCYVTLVTSDVYANGAIILKETLRKVGAKYPLLCLVTNEVSKSTLNILRQAHINCKLVDSIDMPQKILDNNFSIDSRLAETWKNTFTKFRIWELTQYDKIIYLDADLLILKNLDHCFELPEFTAAVDGEYFRLWQNKIFFNSGFLVVVPSIDTFNNIISFMQEVDPDEVNKNLDAPIIIADQDILNMYCSDWPDKSELHLNKYYNIFAPYIFNSNIEDILENGYFIHYVGTKPWSMSKNSDKFIIQKRPGVNDFLNLWAYEVGLTILLYVRELNYGDIDWSNLEEFYKKLAIVAKSMLDDEEASKKFIKYAITNGEKDVYNYNIIISEKVAALSKLFSSFFELNNDATNAYVFSIITELLSGNEQVINFWWEEISKLIKKNIGDV